MSEEKSKKDKKPVEKMIYLQFAGKEVSLLEIEAAIRDNYDSVKKGEDKPENIQIYLKPEDRKAYYVINNDFAGEVDLLVD